MKFDIKKCYRISVIITFFPIFLISSYFARDTFAIFLVSFSLLYFLITENIFLKIFLFISLIFTLYIHRTIYPVALILISIYYFASRRNINVKNKFNSFLIFFSSAFIFIFFSGYFLNSLNNLNYLDEVLELNILLYPVKLLLSLVGPFPWYQYFVSERIVDSYLFQNMLQAVFNISLFITLFRNRINFFKNISFIDLIGFVLFLIGFISVDMHMEYITMGLIFLVPSFVNYTNSTFRNKNYFITFLSIIILNIFYFLFIGELGLKALN